MKPLSLPDVFHYLLEHPDRSKVGSQHGYYALGDAYCITCMSEYQNQVVLVEFRFNDFNWSQYNHWSFRCNRSITKSKPTVHVHAGTAIWWNSPQERRLDKLERKELHRLN